jgi:hypothetical protein
MTFLNQVRTIDKVWMNEFGVAQDVIAALRMRFASLVIDSLELNKQIRRSEIDSTSLHSFAGRSLRIALEQPYLWEYKLLLQAVLDEIHKRSALRTQHRMKIAFGSRDHVSRDNIASWAEHRMAELGAIAEALTKLFSSSTIEEAIGLPGVKGDAHKIWFIAETIGKAYGEALDWAQRVHRTTGA